MKEEVQVAIVGGGAMGVGLLYHLAHEGWTDTTLLEKGELTSGATWHAAGLVPHFIGSLNMAKVHAEAPSLYARLEEETGLNGGWHPTGAIRLALTDSEVDWFRYVQGVLTLVGVESHLLSPSEIVERQPLLNVDDVKLGFWTPNDGWSDPSSSTNAMARGARQLGASIERHTLVTAMNQLSDGRWEVVTDKGRLVAEHVVNAAGCYAPQLGEMVGYDVPIVSVIHQYLVTEAIPEVAELDFDFPVIRDPRASCYYRREIDGLIIGPYERAGAKTYGVDGIDWDLHFHLTPPDHDVLMPWLELAAQRIPVFAEAGIRTTISGPITHTPDSGYLMGPAPGLKNYWVCAGASIGVTQGPGAGKYLAQWMVHGQTEINVAEMDPRRFGTHTYPKGPFAEAKAIDEFHEMYQVRPPGEQRFAGRPIKTTPVYDCFDELGAQWMEIFGWERPQYFGQPEQHTFRRSNALDAVGDEVRGTRERAGIADLTAFTKIEVTGKDAASLLDRLSANKLPGKDGGMRLTHMLTSQGGIECEMTITRLGPDRFYLNSSIMGEIHDLDWLTQHVLENENVAIRDVTNELAILAVSGPRSRDIIQPLTDTDLSNGRFGWLNAKEINVAGVPCIALRVSYVGELGWELHHPIASMLTLYKALVTSGEPHGLVHFGSYAMNEMRIEKGYKAWGSELTTEITPIEARIERFVDQSKDFIGKEAVVARSKEQLSMVLVYCEVDTEDTECRGNEPVYWNGKLVGITTSGTWSHTSNKSLAFAYVTPDLEQAGSRFEIRIMGQQRNATVLDAPAVDPQNVKLKA
ncbi:MAG: aminomethyltransferase [Acidimicrobiaceae bacterium]|nr:aminomethyltransferase [Acidimicrobiaceae bacterium]|tara:strand:+ start:7592 stop:10003 length:2412 start_codon:yes stop_codon:yes gene_type:complete